MNDPAPRYAGWLMGLTAVLMPFVIILGIVNLFASGDFVLYEYFQAGFPQAERFNPPDRLYNSLQTLRYVRGDIGLTDLKNLLIFDKTADQEVTVYNEREVRHLVDVRNVWIATMTFGLAAGILILLALLVLARSGPTRLWAARALIYGGILTLVVIAAIGLASLVNFDVFFVTFHHIFFTGDTWLFLYTDSLIQFYPEPFWEAVSYGIALAVAFASAVVIALGWLWQRALYQSAAVRTA